MTKFEQDKIGRKEIVEKISSLVDNLTKDEHFCLALDGAWGSGKSFVLDMIEEKLIEHKEYTIIKYDAWENSFYEDPLIAILSCVIDSVKEKLSEIQGFKEAFKQFGKEAWNNFVDKYPHTKILDRIVKSISAVVNAFKNPLIKDTQDSDIKAFKSYKQLLDEVKTGLNAITEYNEYEGKQSKLIILVDELDRCLPNEQLKILERLHHLFDVKNCVVICAISMDRIAQNVNTVFGVDGKEYLRKFFDFTFKLSVSADNYLQALLKGFVDSLSKVSGNADWNSSVAVAYQCLKYGSDDVLAKVDNREITRYFDALMKSVNDFGWERLTREYVFFLIIALYIRKNTSSTFLTEKEIKERQELLDSNHMQGRHVQYEEDEMPYVDYLNEYIGVDRENTPDEIRQIYQYRNPIPEISWYFNEIICYSFGRKFNANEMRAFYHQPTVNSEDCQRLRELVILYGGGEE